MQMKEGSGLPKSGQNIGNFSCCAQLAPTSAWVSEDGSGPASIHVDERIALDAVVPLPFDGVSVGLFDEDEFGIPIPCQGRGFFHKRLCGPLANRRSPTRRSTPTR
jgi:hypothetical protein